ncbi:MAG: isoprenylcysteine carboxylmethyltransferase family protein [Candidatus Sericytochromatia bacterium]|nr:isoprenylcysteine carboxylmethyltransferase family protein [Candidatus Sericytochromatia bacterium]
MKLTLPLLVLICVNFAWIGYLPLGFFRRDGQYNLRWWLTGLPFFLVPAYALALQFDLVAAAWQPLPLPAPWNQLADAVAVLLATSSIALITLALGTHRVPLALWHQDNDAPRSIVTYGAYKHIRHPFYTSFLMAFTAGLCVMPGLVTAALLGYQFVALHVTAKREEGRLAASEFGAEYQAYLARTGRFFPRPGGGAA